MKFFIITIIILLMAVPLVGFGQQGGVSQESVDDILEFAPAELINSLEEVKKFLEENPEENTTNQAQQVPQLPAPTTAFLPSSSLQAISSSNDFPLDVVWAVNTFTPPDYKGKSLPTRGTMVRVTAITPTKNSVFLDYSWVVKDNSSSVQGADLKGRGENVFEFFAGRISSNFTHVIEVIASSPSTGEVSSGIVEIKIVQPEVHLYSNQDGRWGYGINSSLSGLSASTLSVLAKPFYFNVKDISSLEFDWRFDAQKVSGINNPDTLLLSITEDTIPRTRKRIDLVVKNSNSSINFTERANVLTNLLITR